MTGRQHIGRVEMNGSVDRSMFLTVAFSAAATVAVVVLVEALLLVVSAPTG
jgi:hypothetical protein